MVFALLILFAMLALGVAGLSAAASGLTLSNNYRTAIQATQAAESGVVHAVRAINKAGGVVDFRTDVASSSAWSGLWPSNTSPVAMQGYPGISYTVTPVAAAQGNMTAPTATTMWITSPGQAPGESQRTINARLGVTGPYTCGAIDLPTTSQITANFNGANFSVDGNDYALGGTTPIQGSTPTLGISTRTQADANTVVSALAGNQQTNVTGTQVPNQIPSVAPCTGPSASRVSNVIVPNILAQPSPPVVTLQAGKINGGAQFGTVNAPQITYFNGDTTLKANGDSSGSGILIVNGSLTIQGNLNFTGLIIVVGSTQIGSATQTDVTGNATVYGAIWTTDLSLRVGGSAAVRYSDQALSLANSIPGITSPLLPQLVNVSGWSEG
jgi:hypothetical protein